MRSHLKVKVVTLAAEMTYIRKQELKWKKRARYAREKLKDVSYQEQNFWSHRGHRQDLKEVARHTHLAYGFMTGVKYEAMERICYGQLKGFGSTEPDWGEISNTVIRFSKDEKSPQDYLQKFSEWLADAKVWYEGNEGRIEEMRKEQALLKF